MLLSIFWHGTPVHDGAVVIQGDQVVEVSTILPLSKNQDLPSHFGTRHRAAAGLTEQTDALVLVVSEERGEVTLFKDKSIIDIKDSIELNRVLRQYTDTVPATNGAKNLTVELFFAAMICLAGVTGIWFSFARGVETLATLEVPVEFVNRNPKMVIFSASASSVKLQISGSGSLIRKVRPEQVKVKLNLANAVAGNNQVAITRDGIVLPPGIELKQLEPQAIEVNFDVAVQKKLPIQPEWTGKLPADFILQDAYTVPETVEVVGGNLTLQGIRTIYTEKIPLENITSDGQVSVTLVLLPSSLKLADESQKHAKVIYKIGRRSPASDAEGK
jgi:diadenylate cyclase